MVAKRGRKWAELSAVAALASMASCASGPARPGFAPALRSLGARGCPEDAIRVLATRQFDQDVVFRIDACGTVLEVEHGLALPRRRNEIAVLAEGDRFRIPPDVRRGMSSDDAEAVRRKVAGWCMLGSTADADADPDAIAFYSTTPAELAQCRARLAQSLVPVGTESSANGKDDILWFTLGQYAFVVRDGLYTPPPEHRIGPDPASDPDADTRRAERKLARDVPPAPHPPQRKMKTRLTGRVQLGGGYLNSSAGDRSFVGSSFDSRIELGLKASRELSIAFLFSAQTALTAVDTRRLGLVQTGVVTTLFPIYDSGFRAQFDASAGVYKYGDEHGFQALPVVGAGVGYDGGHGKRGTDGWTGGALSLDATYGLGDAHVVSILLLGGISYW